MLYFIQSNTPNNWQPALESQIETLTQCIKLKKDVKFIITDPVSGANFNSVCSFCDNHCIFTNQDTSKIRKAIWIESYDISNLPEHNGA